MAVAHGDALAWIVIHLHRRLLAAEAVTHLIAGALLRGVVGRVALLLGGGVRIPVLEVFLDAVTRVAAARCAGDRCDVASGATADLVPDDATDHRAGYGADDLVLVLHRPPAGHGLVVTFLPRRVNRLRERSDLQHLRILGPLVHDLQARHGARGSGHDRADHQTRHQRLVHLFLLALAANGPRTGAIVMIAAGGSGTQVSSAYVSVTQITSAYVQLGSDARASSSSALASGTR